jgi:serine/threonine protein kinase
VSYPSDTTSSIDQRSISELERLGPYQIERRLARGGMADVSLASQSTDLGLKRRVVIKSVLPHLSEDEDFITMFIDEARVMMGFSHPHIAQVFDVGVIDHRHFLSMEYIQGLTLGELLKLTYKSEQQLPYEVCFGISLALAEALDYVHQRCDAYGNWLSIIHRDLKPSNVLIRYDGVVKLIDFGIAQAASKRHRTRTGMVKGTIGYLAPEQILDEAIDQRADVFTLGLLLFQTFIGRYPFPGKSDAMRLRRLMSGDPLDPLSHRPDCPLPLKKVLLSCLASRPADRPYMSELIERLAACAREMNLAPHFKVIGDWVKAHVNQDAQTNPDYFIQSVDRLKAVARGDSIGSASLPAHPPQIGAQSEQGSSVFSSSQPPDIQPKYTPPPPETSSEPPPDQELNDFASIDVSFFDEDQPSQAIRDQMIQAKIDDFEPLLGGDTLFDVTLPDESDPDVNLDQPAPGHKTALMNSGSQKEPHPLQLDSAGASKVRRDESSEKPEEDSAFARALQATTPAIALSALRTHVSSPHIESPHIGSPHIGGGDRETRIQQSANLQPVGPRGDASTPRFTQDEPQLNPNAQASLEDHVPPVASHGHPISEATVEDSSSVALLQPHLDAHYHYDYNDADTESIDRASLISMSSEPSQRPKGDKRGRSVKIQIVTLVIIGVIILLASLFNLR